MSIPERVNLTTGTGWGSGPCVGNTGSVPRLGIPSFCLQDGPQGVRFTDFVTHFPSGLAAGATFNRGLMYLRGKAIGQEHKNKGVHIVLGPTIGPLGLKAAGGRNWESFGADPYLQGAAGAATVEGIQDEGVIATLRHLVGNEQEHFRQVGEWEDNGWERLKESISSNIGDRAMHEIYLWPFADAIRAGAGGVMCSYNRVNNTYACENSYLLNYLLKEELGFQGFVVLDWGAQHTGVKSAKSGLDMTMPGDIYDDWLAGRSFWGPELTRAVFNRTIPQSRLDDMAARILAPFFAIESVRLPRENTKPNFSSWTKHTEGQEFPYQSYGNVAQRNWHVDVRTIFSQQTALSVAREAIVLLKNTNNALPLKWRNTSGKLILIAGMAASADALGFNCKDQKCVDGVLTCGWGSSSVNNPFVVTPYEAINLAARAQNMIVDFTALDWEPEHASELAGQADMAIVVVSAYSGEGYIQVDENYGDRKNLTLWHNGDELIERVAGRCAKTIVVVNSVGPILMEKWIQHKNVVGVLYCPPLGQYVGQAIADIIFGEANPSGKLPFTIARKSQHYVSVLDELADDNEPQDEFDRDIFTDYRFFDKHNIKPRFEFGFGLSYTKFKLSDLTIREINMPSEYLPYPEPYLPVFENYEDDLAEPEDALFPPHFDPVPGFIYPYLFDEHVHDGDGDGSGGGDGQGDINPTAEGTTQHKVYPPLSGGGLGGNPALWTILYQVRVMIENIGSTGGGYVAQLYIELPSTLVASPSRMLRGFEKVFLAPGESTYVTFTLRHRDLAIWDVASQQWILQTGAYRVYVSSSSRKVELGGEIEIGT